MRDFSEKAQAWLDRIAQKTEAPFTLHRNYICGERIFPLVQLMTVRDHHPILSFRTEKGRWGVSGERCYFDVCETLDNAGLDAYFRFLSETQATAVAYTDPEHDYTFVSLVVLTADVNDSALVKRIKRFGRKNGTMSIKTNMAGHPVDSV